MRDRPPLDLRIKNVRVVRPRQDAVTESQAAAR